MIIPLRSFRRLFFRPWGTVKSYLDKAVMFINEEIDSFAGRMDGECLGDPEIERHTGWGRGGRALKGLRSQRLHHSG